MENSPQPKPEILSPAGGKASFLAALAAGADAIYCGLKSFSARMAAENFTVEDLKPVTDLAHEKGTAVYVAVNTILKQSELSPVAETLSLLANWVLPDALIIQDLALVKIARLEGFMGDIHLSTLANVSFPSALKGLKKSFGVSRVVIPRESSIDEIRCLGEACPEGVGLEVFVHGALCYAVSGRCYWSSYLGGKSGLRGRCVQPCRRRYEFEDETSRYFSCEDLSLDVLVKPLMSIPQVRAWKIEGRKKGPHYVYYTCQAYRLFRDHFSDPKAKKTALELLSYSLGRSGTHYYFLSQRPQNPIKSDSHTGSGLFVGELKRDGKMTYLKPRTDILPGDILRLGYEDDPWHKTLRVGKWIPKAGRFFIKIPDGKTPEPGSPVFLIDRKEPDLKNKIADLEKQLPPLKGKPPQPKPLLLKLSKGRLPLPRPLFLTVFRRADRLSESGATGLWMDEFTVSHLSPGQAEKIWWWVPPVIWPEEDPKLKGWINRLLLKEHASKFVLNSPWQIAFFPNPGRVEIWAGPFCNISNAFAAAELKSIGFSGAIVSPELSLEDLSTLPKHSPLPLGIVVSGTWPLCISRIVSEKLKPGELFRSPKSEEAWVVRHGSNTWVYPNWPLDLKEETGLLKKMGFRLFVHLSEEVPKGVRIKRRPGKWNWKTGLE
jgi:putative protease